METPSPAHFGRVLATFSLVLLTAFSTTGASEPISYQGRLTDAGGGPLDGIQSSRGESGTLRPG